MSGFLIDVNLPHHFSLWNQPNYIHQGNLNKEWSDRQIWQYAKEKNLAIVTKDSDFYHAILNSDPPPRVIHLRIGNMRIKVLHNFLHHIWPEVLALLESSKLVIIYEDRLEAMSAQSSSP